MINIYEYNSHSFVTSLRLTSNILHKFLHLEREIIIDKEEYFYDLLDKNPHLGCIYLPIEESQECTIIGFFNKLKTKSIIIRFDKYLTTNDSDYLFNSK